MSVQQIILSRHGKSIRSGRDSSVDGGLSVAQMIVVALGISCLSAW